MTSQPKLMEYFNVYLSFVRYGNSARSTNSNVLNKNFEENMDEFVAVVNEKLEEGWQLLGPPTFSLGWCDMQNGGIAIQSLVRDKGVEHAVVVDVQPDVVVAECVKPLRSSKRVVRSNS